MYGSCYIHNECRMLRAAIPKLTGAYKDMETVADIFDYLRSSLIEEFKAKADSIILDLLFRNHYPNYFKERPEISIRHFDLVLARSLGFQNFEEYKSSKDVPISPNFETAVHLLLTGSKSELITHLNTYPALLFQNSVLGHRARLIDYISSNGVEIWRQIVPLNAAEILNEICKFDFDRYVTNNIYGGSTLRALIESSAHPKAANITGALIEILNKHKL